MKKTGLLFATIIICTTITAQQYLKPFFDAVEYIETLGATTYHGSDSGYAFDKTPRPKQFKKIYLSAEVGLKNQWSLWLREDAHVALISIRGTVNNAASWLENFYAAMVPAKGTLQLNDSTFFNYQLADNPAAMVHVGWTLGLAHLAPAIVQKIKEQYANGVKEFIIMGHSQGGALAFLTTSYLHYLQQNKELPADVYFKTYCSAAPKPGNLFYAYDYDFITRNGWSYTIVNTKDWVPETPFTTQRIADFNQVNPFVNIKPVLKKQKLLVRWYLNGVYNKMNRRADKSQRAYQKYLGTMVYGQVKKILPQFKEPIYTESANYMRAGIPVILQPDEAYNKMFADNVNKIFMHHGMYNYYLLVKKWYMQN